jgi:hypothetical protein
MQALKLAADPPALALGAALAEALGEVLPGGLAQPLSTQAVAATRALAARATFFEAVLLGRNRKYCGEHSLGDEFILDCHWHAL